MKKHSLKTFSLKFASKLLLCCLFSGAFFLGLSYALADEKPIQLGLNWKPEPQFGGFYAAQELKYFDKNGLKVQINEGGSGTPTIQMLATGKLDYAIVSADEIVISHDRGSKDIVALFASYQTNPQCLLTRSENPVDNIKDLLQKSDMTLLWQEGLPYALYLKKKFGPLKIQTAPYSGGIGSLISNPKVAQQGFATSEPLTAKKNKLDVKTFLIAESGYNPYTTVLATTKKRLQSHPEEVKKMIAAVRDGWKSYIKSPEQTNKAMTKLNPAMDLATMNESAAAQRLLIQNSDTGMDKIGLMTAQRWQQITAQLADIGLIKSKPSADELFFVTK